MAKRDSEAQALQAHYLELGHALDALAREFVTAISKVQDPLPIGYDHRLKGKNTSRNSRKRRGKVEWSSYRVDWGPLTYPSPPPVLEVHWHKDHLDRWVPSDFYFFNETVPPGWFVLNSRNSSQYSREDYFAVTSDARFVPCIGVRDTTSDWLLSGDFRGTRTWMPYRGRAIYTRVAGEYDSDIGNRQWTGIRTGGWAKAVPLGVILAESSIGATVQQVERCMGETLALARAAMN